MYTEEYKKAKAKFEKLEKAFNANPCKETATPLAQARVELNKAQKFTDAEIARRNKALTDELIEAITLFKID